MHHGPNPGLIGLGPATAPRPWRAGALLSSVASYRASASMAPLAFSSELATGGRSERTIIEPDVSSDAERVYDRLVDLKVSTAQLAMHLNSDWRAGLFRQLDDLLDAEEWDFSDKLPELSSYKTMLRMLLALDAKSRPSLGATSKGEIIAAWIAGQRRLSVECLPDDQVRWLVTSTIDDQNVRAAGLNRSDLLPRVLQPFALEALLGHHANPR